MDIIYTVYNKLYIRIYGTIDTICLHIVSTNTFRASECISSIIYYTVNFNYIYNYIYNRKRFLLNLQYLHFELIFNYTTILLYTVNLIELLLYPIKKTLDIFIHYYYIIL